jgi:hypothetical protein
VQYRVYLWLTRSSQEAEVVQEVQAVMRSNTLPYAYYAWVVPDSEALPCVERYQVRCASARCRRQ